MAKDKSEKKGPTVADMTARQRLIALRINVRHSKSEGSRLTGRVSEAKTSFKNTLAKAVPDDGEEAKERLRELQMLDGELENAKDARKGFKQTLKTVNHELLYAQVSEAGQTVIPGTEMELTVEMAKAMRSGVASIRAEDKAADDSEDEPKYPAENTADMDGLSALLDDFIKEQGLGATTLGATPVVALVPEGDAAPKRGRGKGEAANAATSVH